MGWAKIEESSSKLVTLHALLTDLLAPSTWSRCQIWAARLSTHEWKPKVGPTMAFDVSSEASKYPVTLVTRDPKWCDRIADALAREGVSFHREQERPERFGIDFDAPVSDVDVRDFAVAAAKLILATRAALHRALRTELLWVDATSGIRIPHSIKPERKNNASVVFMFASIRSKPHWLDFDGPQGEPLSTVRARIVFLHDEFARAFTYHLALEGDTTLLDATVRFVKDYVEREGYLWSQVFLGGMSKGATSALAVASQLPHCQLILVSPQLAVGAYLKENRPGILRTISGSEDPMASTEVDEYFWGALPARPTSHGITSCIILTSENDPHCTEGLQRLRRILGIGDQLEVYVDTSPHTTSHIETVHFHASAFVALLSAKTTVSQLSRLPVS